MSKEKENQVIELDNQISRLTAQRDNLQNLSPPIP